VIVLSDEVKVVFVDGSLSIGPVRSVRGRIVRETEFLVTIQRSDGELTIGKNFIIKIENWGGQKCLEVG